MQQQMLFCLLSLLLWLIQKMINNEYYIFTNYNITNNTIIFHFLYFIIDCSFHVIDYNYFSIPNMFFGIEMWNDVVCCFYLKS